MARDKDKDNIDRFFQYGVDDVSRTIYMGSAGSEDGEETGTDFEMTEYIIKGLHVLESQAPNGDKPITIIMNNIGGDEYHGLAIYDAITVCNNHVTVKVFGHAMSMGGIILQAADDRQMSPNSKFMMHYGTFSIHANAKDAYKWVEENKKMDKWMEDLFLKKIRDKKPKFTRQKLQKMLEADHIMGAAKALEYGLADSVID